MPGNLTYQVITTVAKAIDDGVPEEAPDRLIARALEVIAGANWMSVDALKAIPPGIYIQVENLFECRTEEFVVSDYPLIVHFYFVKGIKDGIIMMISLLW